MRYDDDEYWDEDGDDDGNVSCPYCGEVMLEAAEYCPACDRWMTDEEQVPRKPLPLWAVVLLILLLLIVLIAALRPF